MFEFFVVFVFPFILTLLIWVLPILIFIGWNIMAGNTPWKYKRRTELAHDAKSRMYRNRIGKL